MKPALSPQTTGFLPTWRTSAETSASTCSSVTTVRMISTRPWTGAGLKKWTPMTRPGLGVGGGDLGDRQRRGVGGQDRLRGRRSPSSSRKICFLTSTDSTTASTTKSASVRSLSSVVNVIRPSRSACSSSVIFWRATARPVECSRCWRPRSTPSSFWSTPMTLKPSRANTSAMPAPIVPSPTIPIVSKVRVSAASAVTSVMRRILFDPSVTRAGGRRTSRSAARRRRARSRSRARAAAAGTAAGRWPPRSRESRRTAR